MSIAPATVETPVTSGRFREERVPLRARPEACVIA